MPKVKETTITDIKLAEFYKITPQTLRNWKNSKDERLQNRYKAFKEFYKNMISK